jgi:endonuclease/exonuclease/phosphatase family metal-dependent hydrolase
MYKRYRTNLLLAIFTLLCYVSVLLPPAWWFVLGFFALLIPVLLLLNTLLSIYWLLCRRYLKSLVSFGVLLIGFPFLKATFTWSFPPATLPKTAFTVLSYNVRVFNAFQFTSDEPSRQIIDWAKYDGAAIKCFQEFYHHPKSDVFNTLHTLTKRETYQYFFKPSFIDGRGGQFGLAIFSKHPIVQQGEVEMYDNSPNDAIFVDVVIHRDTVRIYNIHLQSMKISTQRIANTNRHNFNRNISDLAARLRDGFIARSQQIDHLVEHINHSPYPVIVCGDLNDVPYSYTYFRLKSTLKNTFEQAGRGFGYSYNSSWLLIRIDNLFHSPQLQAQDFYTHQEVGYSDHYPIKGTYSVSK